MEELLATLPDGFVELGIALDVLFFLLVGNAVSSKEEDAPE